MKSKLKDEVMDSVGELANYGNLLLREGGFPHLPESQSDVWNDAGTKPRANRVYETRLTALDVELFFQHWNGEFFGFEMDSIQSAYAAKDGKSPFQEVQWREVQP